MLSNQRYQIHSKTHCHFHPSNTLCMPAKFIHYHKSKMRFKTSLKCKIRFLIPVILGCRINHSIISLRICLTWILIDRAIILMKVIFIWEINLSPAESMSSQVTMIKWLISIISPKCLIEESVICTRI